MPKKEKKFYEFWWFWVIMGIVMIFLVSALLVGKPVAEENQEEYIENQNGNIETEDSPALTEFKKEYMIGCDPLGDNTEYCECTFNYLHNSIGLEGLMDFELNGEYPEEMIEALGECFYYYND